MKKVTAVWLTRIFTCSGLWLLTVDTAIAQKLPDVQASGFRAPAAVKADGKISEWNNTFQAYNKNTEVFYTVANDKENLYLVVKSTDPVITNKIMRGGLTFMANVSGKKKDKESVSITFPVFNKNEMKNMMAGIKSNIKSGNNSDVKSIKEADSLMYVMNRRQIDRLKELRVEGIKEITDTLLSIYNEEGIKPRALFDNTGAYNYELAVPLKYLGALVNDPAGFSYSIRLNGIDMDQIPREAITAVNVNRDGSGGPGGIEIKGPGGISFQSLMSVTDFWGKYQLAK